MISKEEYVLARIKSYVAMKENKKETICPSLLEELMEQWAFDYKVEKEYRPEVLRSEQP